MDERILSTPFPGITKFSYTFNLKILDKDN